MKTLILTACLVFFTLFSGVDSYAQEQSARHYVVLTKKIQQLKPILLAAEELKAEDGGAFGNFVVIVCGQEIGGITDAATMDAFLKRADELGVTLVACGFSLNKFEVDRNAVPEEMKIVENGILYNFQLQKKGYYSLGL